MSDSCRMVTLTGAYVQENGIIRDGDGLLIGCLVDDVAFEDVAKREAKRVSRYRLLPEWQLFETAPKDGTEILVYRPDAGVFTAWYRPAVNEQGEPDEDFCFWFTTAGEYIHDDLPTHWMPLPDEPDSSALQGGIVDAD